jgi:mitogen-activated protein kinase organizer 1
MVSAGGDKICFLWDVSSGRVIRRFQGHTQRVNSVKFNPDGTLLFSGSYDKTVQIWDMRSHTREPLQILTDFRDSVSSLALTRTEIIASSVDGCVRVYDIRAGRMHADNVCSAGVVHVTASYDQRCMLSTCLDSSLYLSEIASGNSLQTYRG